MRLEAVKLRVSLGAAEILRGISLAIESGEVVAVVGPNGSGKSTLVRTLSGVLRPAGGDALADGRAVRRMPAKARACQIGLLAQSASVPSLTTVHDHVGLGRHARRSAFARWTHEDTQAVCRAMATCEVGHLAERRVETLSGGERQRVRLATLLAQDPGCLLLDEPLTGLDIEHQLGLLHLLRSLNVDRGITVVCVMHDLDMAMRFFDRLVVVHEGRVVADGPPREVIESDVFDAVFGVAGRIETTTAGHAVVRCARHGEDRGVSGSAPLDVVVKAGAVSRPVARS